jgi:hypothetical protein
MLQPVPQLNGCYAVPVFTVAESREDAASVVRSPSDAVAGAVVAMAALRQGRFGGAAFRREAARLTGRAESGDPLACSFEPRVILAFRLRRSRSASEFGRHR